ncbi:GPI-anchored wall transfer protein isoform 4 [Cucumis melo var. makuwa]|uniref:GPI-anchored wall transfer protein isoform 4 n=2 Tax=Cucumis melo var. makuwa TaxID=1194695 RepID=A0A5A7UBC2_CUCMM|nr:GPI-anchored wall transfer protein isoform 4 [Cucumis melo var. makuwa]
MDVSVRNSLNPNKLLKEEFVSNLTGSSMIEIAALSAIIPVLVLLRHSFSSTNVVDHTAANASLKKSDGLVIRSKSLKRYLAAIAVDFLIIVIPTLLFFTVLADWSCLCAILLILLLLLLIAAKGMLNHSPTWEAGNQSLRANISSFRVVVMITTCLCILAVDFRIFPRRYAKTETYGTSLMDLGVGSFVLANSLVSRQARNALSTQRKGALKSVFPLLILGFIRLITTSGVDYQVHVGEYGVHWNFFFTLSAVSVLTTVINIPPQYSGIFGSIILVGYQYWLIYGGLNTYLLSNQRGSDMISQNKEGLFSIFGYWSIYLIGVQLGNSLFFGKNSTATPRSKRRARIIVWILAVFFWMTTLFLDSYVERVSRRMCNLAYVTLVLAQNLQVLAILMLSGYVAGNDTSVLEEALNSNLLAAFLLANLLTGLVNLSVDTLSTSSISALFILLVYAFILSIAMGLANFNGIRLKFW